MKGKVLSSLFNIFVFFLPRLLLVYPVTINWAMTTESQRYNYFIRNGGNAIPKHACPKANGSNSTAGLTLLWASNSFRGNSNYWQISEEARRKKPGETITENSRPARAELANKVPSSMLDDDDEMNFHFEGKYKLQKVRKSTYENI